MPDEDKNLISKLFSFGFWNLMTSRENGLWAYGLFKS